MSNKLYIKESTTKDSDGEELIILEVYQSKPKKFDYLVWK